MEEFSLLIGQMYDAAIDLDLWPLVLRKITVFLQVARTSLVMEDALDPARSLFYMSYADPEWVQSYCDYFMLINPMRLATVSRLVVGDVILTKDFTTPEQYRTTRFYKEWLATRGLADIAVAVLDRTATTITVLSAKRSLEQGPANEDVRRRLNLLAPHARRATFFSRLFARQNLANDNLAQALERLAAAIVLVGANGTILHANETANALLDEAKVVRRYNDVLTVVDTAGQAKLTAALAEIPQDETAADAGATISLKDRSGDTYLAVVLPLVGGMRRAVASPLRATAAICIKRASFETPNAVWALGELHGLTKRELSVLVATVEWGSGKETANILGLSEETVRSHLKAIYQKTGTHRHADLVKLAAGVVMPMR